VTEATGVDLQAPLEPSGEHVQSLARGLSVIRAFDAEHPVMTLSDIARTTGLTRATSRRLLLTLAGLGYVKVDGRSFSLTARVLELGFSYLSALSLPEIAQPHLESLAASIHESTSASVLDGTDIVYVARVAARRIMSVRISIGTRFPAYATSMGRVLLSGLSPAELTGHISSLGVERLTSRTIDSKGALLRELESVRVQGWALVDQELEDGLLSIAVPVRHSTGSIVAAINVSTTTATHSVDSMQRAFLPALQLAAARIGADLIASQPFAPTPRHPLSAT
jgi:beta-ketoadipate pathway transcriptional regulators, PcaR/PcaU/PobR family